MKSFYRFFFITAIIAVLGLLVWNMYLISDLKSKRSDLKEANLKIQMLEGDVHILNYDLTTSRDSVRILNNLLERKSK